jgi:hypothetical protein
MRDEIMRGWRKLHNNELHNLYSSLNIIAIIKSMRMRRHVACTYKNLVRNPEGKTPLGRTRCR